MKKIISSILVAMMLVACMAMAVSAATSVDVANLPDAVDYSPAGYTQKVLQVGEKSIGTWNLAGITKVVISYGTDHTVAEIADHNVYIKDAAGNVLGQAKLTQPYQFWAEGQRNVEIAINSDYNGELFITKDQTNHMMAIDAITFLTEGEAAPEVPSNPETGDTFVVAVVTVSMIALAGVVVSKKVRA